MCVHYWIHLSAFPYVSLKVPHSVHILWMPLYRRLHKMEWSYGIYGNLRTSVHLLHMTITPQQIQVWLVHTINCLFILYNCDKVLNAFSWEGKTTNANVQLQKTQIDLRSINECAFILVSESCNLLLHAWSNTSKQSVEDSYGSVCLQWNLITVVAT